MLVNVRAQGSHGVQEPRTLIEARKVETVEMREVGLIAPPGWHQKQPTLVISG